MTFDYAQLVPVVPEIAVLVLASTLLLVDLWLPQGSSLKATEAQATKVEEKLLSDPEMKKSIRDFVSYIGNGSPRFYLPLDQQLFNDNFAQLVVVTKDIEAREDLLLRFRQRRQRVFVGLERIAGGNGGVSDAAIDLAA